MPHRIMIVDDSRVVEKEMKRMLADTEYEVVGFFRSGEEAIVSYGELNPDLVTMDIVMPGMDGLTAARELLQRYPDARVVMVSSLAYDDTLNTARELGAKGFIFKPFTRALLLDALDCAFAAE